MICGYLIAAALLPDMAASLAGLYGAQVSGRLTLEAKWWVSGLGMAVLGTLAATAVRLVQDAIVCRSFRLRRRSQGARRRKDICGVRPFLRVWALGCSRCISFGNGLVAGFILIAGVLLGAALLLPLVLAEHFATG